MLLVLKSLQHKNTMEQEEEESIGVRAEEQEEVASTHMNNKNNLNHKINITHVPFQFGYNFDSNVSTRFITGIPLHMAMIE